MFYTGMFVGMCMGVFAGVFALCCIICSAPEVYRKSSKNEVEEEPEPSLNAG